MPEMVTSREREEEEDRDWRGRRRREHLPLGTHEQPTQLLKPTFGGSRYLN